jgi:hypothetical protein
MKELENIAEKIYRESIRVSENEIKVVELTNSANSPLWDLVFRYGRLFNDNEYDEGENYWKKKAYESYAILVLILHRVDDESGVVAFDWDGDPVPI